MSKYTTKPAIGLSPPLEGGENLCWEILRDGVSFAVLQDPDTDFRGDRLAYFYAIPPNCIAADCEALAAQNDEWHWDENKARLWMWA